jgi:protein-tyrosine-phosphatase
VKYVLFVCTHNAGRSQIAQALFERDAPPGIRAESARQEPAEQVWPPDPAGRPLAEVRAIRNEVE